MSNTGDAAEDSRTLLLRFGHDELVVRRRYEVLSVGNDLLIAVWFVVGSVLFFWESTSTVGTWFFLVGSIQLAGRPVIRLRRRIHLLRFRPDAPAETARDF